MKKVTAWICFYTKRQVFYTKPERREIGIIKYRFGIIL